MSDPLRIVQLNLAYDGALASATALLERYHTLTGWSRAVSGAGAFVQAVQRFHADGVIEHDKIGYTFVQDGSVGTPRPWSRFARVLNTVHDTKPDVVHVNGLMFPGMVSALRRELPQQTAIVLQDHSGHRPRATMRALRALWVGRWRRAFEAADACTFTAAELAAPWYGIGLPRDQRVLEIPEASTDFEPSSHDGAKRATGMSAEPAILWVGRLDANKDPLTVLSAMENALPQIAGAHCWMIYDSGDLEHDVRRRIESSKVLRTRVTMVGAVRHQTLAAYYSAADVFVSGSHHEGSGYALIEAMACGVTPCVTDIPAFRALTAGCGARWAPGDADACATALLNLVTYNRETQRVVVRRRFNEALRWDVIGRQTVREYADLVERRAGARLK